MTNRTKFICIAIAASFPLMMTFQNCAPKSTGDSAAFGDSAANAKAAPVVTDDLPLNKEVAIDENNQTGGQASSSSPAEGGEGSVGIQIEDRELEREKDINEAIDACEALALQPVSDVISPIAKVSEGGLVIEHIRGAKVLSPADFGGENHLKRISNAYGKIVLCGLIVDEVIGTGGQLILYNSKINKVLSHHGVIYLVDGSAIIDASNVNVFRTSLQSN